MDKRIDAETKATELKNNVLDPDKFDINEIIKQEGTIRTSDATMDVLKKLHYEMFGEEFKTIED